MTHHCFEPKELVERYPRGRRELLGAFSRFQPRDTCEWFAAEGVELKVEADGRMFPVSNNSQTIRQCLLDAAKKAGVELKTGWLVKKVELCQHGFELHSRKGDLLRADKVLLATGSAPFGQQIAAQMGHVIESPVPSLFTFNISDEFLEGLAGQSVSEVQLELSFDPSFSKRVFRQSGPLLVTHWGLSGPAVLKLSAFAARLLAEAKYNALLKVNWLPQYNQDSCFHILKTFKEHHRQKLVSRTAPFDFSKRLWQRFTHEIGEFQWERLGNHQLRQIAENLCSQKFKVDGKGVFKEEFVTCGGVKRSEINFTTMESKIVPGLYFAGEVIDIDGITGGFNFQNAWTTGWIAAQSLAEK